MIRGKLKQLPQLQQKQRETLIEKLNDSSNSQIRELVGESLIIQTEELEQERIWMESIYKEHLHDTEKLICGPTRLWESSQLTDLMIKQRLNSIINNIRKDLERTKGLEITLNQSTNFEFIKSKHPLNIKKIREYLESMKRYNEDRINDYQLKLDMEQEVRDHNLLVELSHTKDLTIFKKLLDTIEFKFSGNHSMTHRRPLLNRPLPVSTHASKSSIDECDDELDPEMKDLLQQMQDLDKPLELPDFSRPNTAPSTPNQDNECTEKEFQNTNENQNRIIPIPPSSSKPNTTRRSHWIRARLRGSDLQVVQPIMTHSVSSKTIV